MTYVRNSGPESSSRDPQPGSSGTQNPKPPKTPTKSKGTGKTRNPIKHPSNTPAKNEEDVPLSRVFINKPACAMNLRTRLDGEPETPLSDRGAIWSRLSPRPNTRPQEVWDPFLTGQNPANNRVFEIEPWLDAAISHGRQGTPHHGRQFITGRPILRDEGTMTDPEPENTARENNVQNVTRDDVTSAEEAEVNERGSNKE
jgi:hypothetical protein